MSFIEININNSFNKSRFTKKQEEFFNNSTLSNEKKSLEINSASVSSITNNQNNGNILLDNFKQNKESIVRKIMTGTICTVLGAMISYFIFGIK